MRRIGVVGAGTMGTGIAQVAAQSGFDVCLYDVAPAPLEAGMSRIRSGLDRLVQRGRLSAQESGAILERVCTTTALTDLGDSDFVIEAAPEDLALKRTIFAELDRVCAPGVVLATNTSSLSVTEISALTGRQEFVVGMHFFNPVPIMKLVEVVRGTRTGEQAAEATAQLARQLGKTPVLTRDTPGFIVNRIARPFPGEALRLLGENVAVVRQIDRSVRMGAGFRMGPFELMDLVGMDVNYAVNHSVFEQFLGEPRFRPHPLQAQMVKANLLGRKTGAGWYRYEQDRIIDGPQGPQFLTAPAPRVDSIQKVWAQGEEGMAQLSKQAGYALTACLEEADLVVLGFGMPIPNGLPERALVLLDASAATITLAAAGVSHPERVAGYSGVPSVLDRQLIEIGLGLRTSADTWQLAAAFIQSLGRDTEVIHDGPGLITPRVIACLVNEAAYALMEGVATAADIDTAMKLGLNYPKGPLEWADELGPETILQILAKLHQVTGEDRYRPCPYLKKLVAAGMKFSDVSNA